MNIREAILKAADHIEAYPQWFDYNPVIVPSRSCGTPGCALGWIGFFMGLGKKSVADVAFRMDLLGGSMEFYDGMNKVNKSAGWISNAEKCAKALRLYADKYHPASKELTVYRDGADIVADMLKEKVA